MTTATNQLDAGKPRVTSMATFTPGEDGWICAQIVELPEAISPRCGLEEAGENVVGGD